MTDEGAPARPERGGDPAKPKPDRELERKIKAALRQATALRLTKVQVEAIDGEIVLTGIASDPDEIERAIALAEQFDATASVVNRLTLRSQWRHAAKLAVDPGESAPRRTIAAQERTSRRGAVHTPRS
jgi:Flp pilus assembly secretin CpaC